MLAKPILLDHDNALIVRDATKQFNSQKTAPWGRFFRRNTKDSAANGKAEAETSGSREGKRTVLAVDHVSFEVKRGEIFGVLGPNGSGKSTLIRLISTLLSADSGSISIFGLDLATHEMDVKRMINRVSVDAAFFKKLSPMENLLYGGRLYGVGGKEAEKKAIEILGRLGLEKSSFKEPMEEMSRGMQQKVAIARAFLTAPILLLLDEPTTGLDPRSKREVRAFVEELRDTHDATIVITTHDMEEADALCDRIAIVNDGKIVAMGTPAQLKARLPRPNRRLGSGHEPTLEDVFMSLTGKVLIDADQLAPEEI
jgi:ABC-2 type transport system ATP-binding protein